MADIKLKAYPDGTGTWSDGGIWIGGVAPGAGDVAFINGNDNVVTLDGDVTVQYVTRDSGYGAVDFAGYTMTTTGGLGGAAWNKPRIRNSVPGGKLLITCATDGEWFVFVYYTLDSGGTLSNPFEIAPATDDGNHRINLVQLHAAQLNHVKGLRIHGCKGRTFYASYGYGLLLEDCDFYDGDYVHFAHCSSIVLAGEVYVHGQNHVDYGVRLGQCGMVSGHGLICGKNIDGTAHGNIGADIKGLDFRVNLKNSVVDTVKVELLDSSLYGQYSIHLEGLGYAGSSHLCNDESTPYEDYRNWAGVGTCQKVSSSDPTRRITPNNNVSTTKPLRLQLPSIPASGGEQISLNLVAQAGVAAHECSLVLDPDNLYGAYAIQTKDCETSETTFSVSATLTAGSYGVQVPVEFRVREYNAGGSVDVKSASATVGGSSATLDLDAWTWTVIGPKPSTPSISVENDEIGTSATVTITGGDADATHRLFYRTDRAAGWTAGLTRTGNGEKQQTGLEARWYQFHVVPDNGILGYPSNVAAVTVAPATDLETGTEFEDEYQAAAREPLLEVFGTEVLYRFADASTATIKAMLTEEELSPRPTDRNRTLSVKVHVLVFKTDVPTVTRNGDEMDVPGAWVSEDTVQTLRVATVEDTRAGTWLLGLT